MRCFAGLAAIFNRVAQDRDSGCYLYETSRSVVLPPLSIRRARVEDHDDLVPVLEASGKRYPALAKLPDSCRPQEAFALSRLVAGQDEQNSVLVALSGKKLVGIAQGRHSRLPGAGESGEGKRTSAKHALSSI